MEGGLPHQVLTAYPILTIAALMLETSSTDSSSLAVPVASTYLISQQVPVGRVSPPDNITRRLEALCPFGVHLGVELKQ